MKKTLIALMALAGVAAAAPSTPSTITSPADYSYVVYEGTDLTLTSATVVDAKSMISNMESVAFASTQGYFIANTIDKDQYGNDRNNCSPGFGKVVLTLTLTDLTGTGNIFCVSTGSTDPSTHSGWGLALKENGALTFARYNSDITIVDEETGLGTVTADTTYTITIVSNGVKNASGIVGRGTDNFNISVFDGTTEKKYTADGFGLNGNNLDKIVIGQANGVNGKLSVTAMVPEPATATLSLLALAGLCARRRRS